MEEENQAIASQSRRITIPEDLVDNIFLRLPVKTLYRFKSLSKQWRSNIQSRSFKERHVKIAERSSLDHPKVMVVSTQGEEEQGEEVMLDFTLICSDSASHLSCTSCFLFLQRFYVSESCDGLFCVYSTTTPIIYVFNPVTWWQRELPPLQILTHNCGYRPVRPVHGLAFVKGPGYKLVWLYNSNDTSGVTKCVIFDFRLNSWRYLTCTPNYRIYNHKPAYANGSLYWLTQPYNGETKVVALDIHTEKFRLLPEIHSVFARLDARVIDMYTLDNCLCMSSKRCNMIKKEIWRLKLPEETWEKMYTIKVSSSSAFSQANRRLSWKPVAICKNKKILLSHRYAGRLVQYDPQTKSLNFFANSPHSICAPYFESLISHI